MAYLGKITPEQLEKLDPNNTLLRPQVTIGKKLLDLRNLPVVGPDDPIYSSGLTVTSTRALKPSTTTSQSDTAGTNPAPQEK